MARQIYLPSSQFPYHITARACNREHYPIPLCEVWRIMCEELTLTHHLYELFIHAFVLMPNHFHLLASTPQANLCDAMRYFMSNTSKAINRVAGKINQNHGTRYFKCLIKSPLNYEHSYKYVYRNPVKAYLSDRVEEYEFSSLQMYLGQQTLKFPFEADETLMNDIESTLEWLNKAPEPEHLSEVKRALRGGEFILPTTRTSRRKSLLEYKRL
jgi:putative transposase